MTDKPKPVTLDIHKSVISANDIFNRPPKQPVWPFPEKQPVIQPKEPTDGQTSR